MNGFLVAMAIVLFGSITFLNVMSWKHSARVERDFQTCVQEYQRLVEECPCPSARK